jgi:hypothetical protein
MGKFQFRKRIKISKGVSLNLSKRGAGISAGPRGAKISRSADGRLTGSAGIPGSGVSYRRSLNGIDDSESEDFNENSLLLNIIENSAYISVHGPVLSNSEMKKALLLLTTSTLSLVGYLLTVFTSSFGFLFNPFLFLYVVLVVGYLLESKKNKELVRVRKIEHLKDCSHIEKIDQEVSSDPLVDQLMKLSELFEKGLIDESEYKASKAKILGLK